MNDHPNTAQLRQLLEGDSASGDPWPGLHTDRCPACLAKLDRLLAEAVAEAPAVPPVPGLLLPGVVGYEVLSVLGRGGAGVVFKARQTALGRPVALKVLLSGTQASAEEREGFSREANALAELNHPNLVTVYDAGVQDGVPYLAMELVEGVTLRERLTHGALTPPEAALLLHTLARAVAAAHDKGIIHRDLKPSNVLLAPIQGPTEREGAAPGAAGALPHGWALEGVPKVTDFGLARRLGAAAHPATGALRGTPGYMAPEQVRGGGLCKATDVWGLGAILYECLTGRPPFVGDVGEQLSQTTAVDPQPPSLSRPSVPRDLDVICLKCLHKEPSRRYADAAELADDLGRWLRGEPVKARPVGSAERAWRWAGRNPAIAALAAVLAVVVGGGFTATVALWRQAERHATEASSNLAKEEEARREADEQFEMLLPLLATSVSMSGVRFGYGNVIVGKSREESVLLGSMLANAESTLTRLLQRRQQDVELRMMLSRLLIHQGKRQSRHGSPAHFEKAARLWDGILVKDPADPNLLHLQASIHGNLAWGYGMQGRLQEAVPPAEVELRLLKQVAATRPDLVSANDILTSANHLGRILRLAGCSEAEIGRRFEDLREQPGLVGDVLRADYWCGKAEELYQAKNVAAALDAARKAAAIHGRYYREHGVDRVNFFRIAERTGSIASRLRRGGAPAEALALVEQMKSAFQNLPRRSEDAHHHAAVLSEAWAYVGKFRWNMTRGESALDAYREALAAQRQACDLVPESIPYRELLSSRHLQLGRSLCQLGRLEEAERCFRDQQVLWPGDADLRALGLRELRKWAGQVGDAKRELTPAERQDRQRYLDLLARLEKKPAPARP